MFLYDVKLHENTFDYCNLRHDDCLLEVILEPSSRTAHHCTRRAGNGLDGYHSNKRACPCSGQQPGTTPFTGTASRDGNPEILRS